MNDSFKVTLLWIALILALTLLVMVLSVTGETDSKQRVEIKELKQDKNNLIQELKTKKINEKAVAETKKKLKSAPVYVNPLGKEKLVAAVYATFGKDPRILTLIQCESSWNERSLGYDGHPWYQYNYGLFQVASTHGYSAEYLFNPYNNIKVAKQIYDRQSWSAWPQCSKVAGLV